MWKKVLDFSVWKYKLWTHTQSETMDADKFNQFKFDFCPVLYKFQTTKDANLSQRKVMWKICRSIYILDSWK